MPQKKIRPPPIVKVTYDDIPPHFRADFEAGVKSKCYPKSYPLSFLGWKLSLAGAFTPTPENIGPACEVTWKHLSALIDMDKRRRKSIALQTSEERKEREAAWAAEQKRRKIDCAVAKAKAEGKMSKRLSRREEIRWVDDRLGEVDIKPEDAPTAWCFNTWLDYHGTAEGRDVFRTKFSAKIVENDKSAEQASKRSNKSSKTIELLDDILSQHIEATANGETTASPAEA